MARGKITPYEVGSFSPSAVGVSQENQSGQIVSQGIAAIGKALIAREDASNTLEAMNQFGSFELAYQQKKIDLQKQYVNDPAKYPEAVRNAGLELADSMSGSMGSSSAKKFRQMTSSSLSQDVPNSMKWYFTRDSEIQVGKITSIKQNLALQASTVASAKDLEAIKVNFTKASTEATKLIDKESDTKLTEQYWKLAKTQAMSAQVFAQPMKLMRELEGGTYDKLLTPEEKLTWKNKARDAVYNRAIDDQYRTMFMAQGKLLDFQNGIENGTFTIADLVNEREAAYANRNKTDVTGKPIVSQEYIKGLDNLIDITLYAKQRVPGVKEARAASLKDFDTEWDQYLQEKKMSKQGPSEQDVEKELGMYAKLSGLYRNGDISKDDFDRHIAIMRTKLSLRQGQKARVRSFSEAIDQAGTVPTLWWRTPGNDVVSLGYQMIKSYVDTAYRELGTDERRDLKAQMLSQYHQKIQAEPEDNISKLATENERRQFASERVKGVLNEKGFRIGGIINTNVTYTEPETGKVYQIGDIGVKNGYKVRFTGKDPETGTPTWKFVPGQIVTNANGQQGLVQDDGSIKRL